MMKRFFSRTLAILSAAAAISSCGALAVEAAADPAEPEAAAVTMAQNPEDEVTIAPVKKVLVSEDSTYKYYIDDQTLKESKEKKTSWVKVILVALGVSAVITGVVVYIIYRGYKYNGMTEPYEYKNKAPLELREREDQLVDVHVTSRKINRDNN